MFEESILSYQARRAAFLVLSHSAISVMLQLACHQTPGVSKPTKRASELPTFPAARCSRPPAMVPQRMFLQNAAPWPN